MKGRRRKLVNILLLLLLIAVVSVAGSYLFRIETVEFAGSTQYTYDELLSNSGISKGANILMLDKQQIKANLESRYQYFISVKNIERIFPNKVKITVEERKEYAMVEYEPGVFVTLDQKGYMVRRMVSDPGLILIKGAGTLRVFEPGVLMISQKEELMETAIEVYTAVYSAGVSQSVLSIDVSKPASVTMELTGGFSAVIGDTDKLSRKLVIIDKLLQKYKEEGKTGGTFNVSVPDYPVYSENN